MRAAEAGISLSDYLLDELRRVVERTSPRELAERAAVITREDFATSPAAIVREDRDRRSS